MKVIDADKLLECLERLPSKMECMSEGFYKQLPILLDDLKKAIEESTIEVIVMT